MRTRLRQTAFILIGCMAVLAAVMTSCKKKSSSFDIPDPNIIGTWEMVDLWGTMDGEEINLKDADFPFSNIIVFNADGTYTGNEYIGESGFNEAYDTDNVTEKGTWRMSDDKLTMSGTITIGDQQVKGSTVYTVKKLTATELVIETSASSGGMSMFVSATFHKIK
ncbi:MAG: lipocalin family protein [Paludibacteraceae bacterium]|nr:lipocalin family protein [Paludibacteraceae bacterium]